MSKISRSSRMLALVLGLGMAAFANSAGAPPGYSGAPGDGTCVACHIGSLLNSGSGSLTITFPDANGYVPGQKYSILVTLQDPTAKRWGFELTTRNPATNFSTGALAIPASSTVVNVVASGPNQYATQTLSGTFAQQVNQAAWNVDFTAPVAGTGSIQIYAAGLAANNDGSPSGDLTYSTSITVAEQTSTGPPPVITVGNTILSQFVFGGGWYTAIYFTNQSGAEVSFTINYYSDFATQMAVNGNTSQPIVIPASGAIIVQALNSGSLTSGWATFNLPAGVTGYGVFRQSVQGRPDQEAVVPYTGTTSTKWLLLFDDTSYTTSAAIWYDGPSNATVTMSAFDEGGNSLGTTTLSMVPGTKQSFAVTDQLPLISGRLGSLIVSTNQGTISVLGLRFGGSAFTSIPATAEN